MASHPSWKAKCKCEVDVVIAKYRKSVNQSPAEILNALDIEIWESEFQTIDNCLRETIRLAMPGTVFRKNTSGRDIAIGNTGEVIPDGSFAAFIIDNVQLNPKIYPDPHTFNPGRYSTIQVDEPHTFVGWGSGCHPCCKPNVMSMFIE